jgi:hypothetical protein
MKCRRDAGTVGLMCHSCQKSFTRQAARARKPSKTGLVFCSVACLGAAKKIGGPQGIVPAHYGTGDRQYRALAIRQLGPVCRSCGYERDRRMLDVHHKDGDRQNNAVGNLEVLCVWCHALLTRKVPTHIRRPKRVNQARVIPIVQLLALHGLFPSEIARRLGMPFSTVYYRLKQHGVRYRDVLRGDRSSCEHLLVEAERLQMLASQVGDLSNMAVLNGEYPNALTGHRLHTAGVTGSSPVAPTNLIPQKR